jgi:small subunit ribosomal protein S6
MVRDYELMYIVRPDVDDDGLRAAVDSVKSLVEGQGGEVRKTTMWGKRRLAYEVKHLRDGHYVIVELRLDGSKVVNVERALRIHDTVFRHLLVVQEVPSPEGEDEEGENGVARAEAGESGDGTASAAVAAVEPGDATADTEDADTAGAAAADEPQAAAEETAASADDEAEEPHVEPAEDLAPAAAASDDEEA